MGPFWISLKSDSHTVKLKVVVDSDGYYITDAIPEHKNNNVTEKLSFIQFPNLEEIAKFGFEIEELPFLIQDEIDKYEEQSIESF